MYLKCHSQVKEGKEHLHYSIAEKVSCSGGCRVERHIYYLGEVNDSQRKGRLKLLEAFDEGHQQRTKLGLFASNRPVPMHAADFAVQVRVAEFRIERPLQTGACWVFVYWRGDRKKAALPPGSGFRCS